MTDRDLKTIAAMKKYGGSFVEALAEAAYRADERNLLRLKLAFSDLWERYDRLAQVQVAGDEHEQRKAGD